MPSWWLSFTCRAVAGLSLAFPPSAQEGTSFGWIPQRDARAAHEPAHGHGRLPGEQLDMVQRRPAGPVEVFDERGSERDRLRKPLPYRAARRHPRDVVRGENRGDEIVRIQRPDQLDPVGYGLVGDTAGPDRDAERMRTAQHGMPRHSSQFADPVGG